MMLLVLLGGGGDGGGELLQKATDVFSAIFGENLKNWVGKKRAEN